MLNFQERIESEGTLLVRDALRCLQINVGYRCNLKCSHCHVEAGPDRTEVMDWAVMEDLLAFADRSGVKEIDITGGAPETNPHLAEFIRRLRRIETVERILLRTNLAILEEPGYEAYPELFARHNVEVVASMPCYLEENVEAQRGKGVHPRNIRILKKLNLLGYGMEGSTLKLHLVYNPLGNFLPALQSELEADYKEHLRKIYGISFHTLFTITNMPIGRFRAQLVKQGLLENYQALLASSFNRCNLEAVMCRSLISIDWRGKVFDCDFNQALGMPLKGGLNISRIDPGALTGQTVVTGNHCYACVAGSGSSCQGNLADKAG
ncbi:MAG: radical SAM/Cys-rich domain protein [Firmicutes bacterium]|nr:radical SAM/Cys-rich domain protein [Bacillota bacterium]